MNLEFITKRLSDKRIAVRGRDLFIMNMPAEVRTGYLLRDADFVGTPINAELPGYRRGKFQLIVRCEDYETGAAMMDKAAAAITIEQEGMVGGVFVKYCRPRNEMVSYPLMVSNNYEFSMNFDAVYVIV
jgi:hypothetical protein